MHNLALYDMKTVIDPADCKDCEINEMEPARTTRDSLSENFNDELDAWARRALAANGFGDYSR